MRHWTHLGLLLLLPGLVAPACGGDPTAAPAADTEDDGEGGGGLTVVNRATDDASGGPETVSCSPGTVECESSEQRVVCNEDGDGWQHAGVCNLPKVCDLATATCMDQVCSPDEPACTSDGLQMATCNASGTAVLDDDVDCEEGTSCVVGEGCQPFACEPEELGCVEPAVVARCRADGQTWEEVVQCGQVDVCSSCLSEGVALVCEGIEPGGTPVEMACGDDEVCVDVFGCTDQVCVPGEYGCHGVGVAWQCDDDGLGWTQAGKPCTDAACLQCVELDVVVTCPNPAGSTVTPTDHVVCDAGSACVKGQGCVDWKCTPANARCANATVLEICADDGQAWSADLCHPYATCSETSDVDASCACDGTPGCALLDLCLELQPPATSVGWQVPDEPRIVASFRPRPAPEGKSTMGVIQTASIASPWSGEPLPLDGATDDDGEPLTSTITVSLQVDGEDTALDCGPPTDELPAVVDIAFLVDVRPPMAATHALLAEQIPLLVESLTAQHFDVRIGLLLYSDEVPALASAPVMLAANPAATVAALAGATAQLAQSDLAENGVEAVEWAVDGFSWREGAQRLLVLAQEDVMHDPVDKSEISETPVTDVLALVHREYQVHVLTQSENTFAFGDAVHPDPRVLSCATGGRNDDLFSLTGFGALDIGPIGTSFEGTHVCTFPLQDPATPKDLVVTITATHDGAEAADAAQRHEVSFEAP